MRRLSDLRRIIAIAVAVAAVAVFAGGTWYAYKRMSRPESGVPPLIKAETGPAKMAPDDPGGVNVPNRDKQVFDRMAGSPGARPGEPERLLPAPERAAALPPPPPPPSAAPSLPPPAAVGVESLPPPRPGAAPATTLAPPAATISPAPLPATAAVKLPPPAAPSAAPAAAPASPPRAAATAAAGQTRIQLVAMRDAQSAVAAWQKLKQQHAQVLGPLSPIFERADLGDKGVYHRVQAGPFADRNAAAAACATLKAAKQDCVVVIR
jgi:hypothetical protein